MQSRRQNRSQIELPRYDERPNAARSETRAKSIASPRPVSKKLPFAILSFDARKSRGPPRICCSWLCHILAAKKIASVPPKRCNPRNRRKRRGSNPQPAQVNGPAQHQLRDHIAQAGANVLRNKACALPHLQNSFEHFEM